MAQPRPRSFVVAGIDARHPPTPGHNLGLLVVHVCVRTREEALAAFYRQHGPTACACAVMTGLTGLAHIGAADRTLPREGNETHQDDTHDA